MYMPIFIIFLLLISKIHANSINTADYSARVLAAVNKYRFSKGLPALQANNAAALQAKKHSNNMAGGFISFGHYGFNDRVKKMYAAIKNHNGASENIAYFPPSKTPEQVVKMWLTSRGHRHNIEGNYQITGIGVAVDRRGWIYYTQEFVAKT